MRYSLKLSEDNRVLSVTYERFAVHDSVIVEELPDGDIYDYRYENGSFVYDPITEPEIVENPSQLDRVEAQAVYTAMMTDTLLESEA